MFYRKYFVFYFETNRMYVENIIQVFYILVLCGINMLATVANLFNFLDMLYPFSNHVNKYKMDFFFFSSFFLES